MSENNDQCEFPEATAASGYAYGCRCERCRAANALKTRKYRARNREAYNEKQKMLMRERREAEKRAQRGSA